MLQLFLLILVLTSFNCPCASAASEPSKHFLWSVTTPRNTIFLLGSMHALKGDVYPLAKEIEKAYEDSKKIVFETDVDKTQEPEWQRKMMSLGVYLDGQTLAQNVSKDTYRLLAEKITGADMELSSFDPLKPWLCALTLTVMELQKLGFDPGSGIDTHFHQKAKADGKHIMALEPPEDQLNLFTTMDRDEEEAFLRQVLDELQVIGTMAREMQEAWETGDVKKLDGIIKLSFKDHPRMYERFVVARNKNWVRMIDELAGQNENVLIVVGAAHLVGRNNLVELLGQKGYSFVQR